MLGKFLYRLAFGFAVAVTVAALLWSCDNGNEYEANTLTFRNGEVVRFESVGQFLEIRSDRAWTLEVSFEGSPEADWCEPKGTWGAGGGTDLIWIEYGRNGGATRTADFTVDFSGTVKTIRLTQLSERDSNGEPLPSLLELPQFATSSTKRFVTHYVPDRGTMRNYSIFYDTENHIPLWVAYPMHTVYTPSGSRSDDWQFDPLIAQSEQPNLFGGIASYDRGHMLPSASRYLAGTNEQTFFFTNMTPQINGFNGYLWAKMEANVRAWQGKGADTLYVVTGAVLRTVGGNENISYATPNRDPGRQMAIPNYYYKALLKRDVVNDVPQYKAVAFWFRHQAADRNIDWDTDAITVRELERRTGINFFAGLEQEIQDVVETTKRRSDWNL